MTDTAMQRADFDKYMVPVFSPMPMICVRGEGARLWDQQGRDYIDFGAGIAVTALGHSNPRLIKALTEQAAKVWHVSNYFTNEPALALAKKMTQTTFAERVFFANSGAEANEAALKLARKRAIAKYGEKKIQIVAFNGSFHGRTFLTVSVGGQKKYSSGMGPVPEGIVHVDYNDIEAVKRVIGENTCAVILEPVIGEGGVIPATAQFLKTLRELCTEHDAALIFDEIQSGNGRTGHLYAYMGTDVVPDILTTAKGLGNGFPIGAMLTTAQMASSFSVGAHGTTFGGNPLACAIAGEAFDMISDPVLLEGVRNKAQYMAKRLREIGQRHGCFSEVREAGLWFGCELSGSLKDQAGNFVVEAANQGLIMLQAGTNVLRIATSLLISEAEMDEGLRRLELVCASLLLTK